MNYKYPYFGKWATSKGLVWLVFEVKEIVEQKTLGRGEGQLEVKPTGVSYEFLAPNEIMENIQHEWAEYDSMNSRLSDLMVGAGKEFGDAASTLKSVGLGLWESIKNGKEIPNSWSAAADYIRNKTSGTVVSGYKSDTPLVYKNSARREYTFEFEFAAYSDAYHDVYKPIEDLRFYSSPGLKNPHSKSTEGLGFTIPYIFKISAKTGDSAQTKFLFIEAAALISIQPTFKGPYQGGFPTYATVQLTFREIPPLFRENFYGNPGGYVGDKFAGNKSTITVSSTT